MTGRMRILRSVSFVAFLLLTVGVVHAETVNCSSMGACEVCDNVDDFDDSLKSIFLGCYDEVGVRVAVACYASGGWVVILSGPASLFVPKGDPVSVAYRFDKELAQRETWNSSGGSMALTLEMSTVGLFREGLAFASTVVFKIEDGEVMRLDLPGGPEKMRLLEKRCAAMFGG